MANQDMITSFHVCLECGNSVLIAQLLPILICPRLGVTDTPSPYTFLCNPSGSSHADLSSIPSTQPLRYALRTCKVSTCCPAQCSLHLRGCPSGQGPRSSQPKEPPPHCPPRGSPPDGYHALSKPLFPISISPPPPRLASSLMVLDNQPCFRRR